MGVLDKLSDAASKMGTKMASAPNSEAAGIRAKQANVKQYMDAVGNKPEPPAAPPSTGPMPTDKINKNGKFGDRPGEKVIDTKDMVKPLGSYKKGTTNVPKTGTYKLHKNEAVVPAHENPMNPDAMYDKVPGMPAHKPAKKEIEHVRIRKAKSGGHIVEHHHTHPGDHKMEEHVMPSMDMLHAHLDQHMGDPNMGESAANSPAGMSPAPAAPAMDDAGGASA